jgi:hypothetical protein
LTGPPSEIEAMDTADGHATFIRSQWRDFAAFAWEKYLAEGRGALVVDLRRALKTGADLQVPTYYVADRSERLRSRGGWPSSEVAEVIKEYDPEQDVIFLFLRLDGDLFHYNVSDELTPPEAYRLKRASQPS